MVNQLKYGPIPILKAPNSDWHVIKAEQVPQSLFFYLYIFVSLFTYFVIILWLFGPAWKKLSLYDVWL